MNDQARKRLEQGAAELGLVLSREQVLKFQLLNDELKKWSRKVNLTAIQGDEQTVIKHFLDSLTLVHLLGEEGTLLDIGSGAGFPALPIKIVRPRLQVVTVDAVEKKIIFQRQAGRIIGLDGFTPLHHRVEELPESYLGHFDWIVSRAFADLPTFARLALPLIKSQGKIIAMKGGAGKAEAEAASESLSALRLDTDVEEFPLPQAEDRRSLVTLSLRQPRERQERP